MIRLNNEYIAKHVTTGNIYTIMKERKLPMKVRHWMSRILIKLEAEKKAFDMTRDSLIFKYGIKEKGQLKQFPTDNGGMTFRIAPEHRAKFVKEMDKLALQEFEIPFKPLPKAGYGTTWGNDMNGLEIAAIIPIMEELTEEEIEALPDEVCEPVEEQTDLG